MELEQLLTRLEGVRGSNGQHSARCPAHEDRQASLSIGIGEGGRILLSCHAGCELGAVLAALELEPRDLFADSTEAQRAALRAPAAPWGDRPLGNAMLPREQDLEAAAVRLMRSPEMLELALERKGWDSTTLAAVGVGLIGDRFSIPVRDPAQPMDGALVNVLRYRPDRQPKMLATPRCPRTPLILTHNGGGLLFIVEGETDAISVGSLGFEVIGAPGAATKPAAEWFELVRDREVIVCFDCDDPGRRAAARWASTALKRGAASVRLLELEGDKGYDVGDWLRERRGDRPGARVELAALAAAAPLFELEAMGKPPEPPEGPQNGRQGAQASSPPKSASSNGAGAELEPGELVLRPLAGVRMRRVQMLWSDRIPVGRAGILYGPPGQGKSTLLATIAAEVTRAGGRVLIASAEDDPEGTLRPRIAAAGADLDLVDLISTKVVDGETNLVLPRDLPALRERMLTTALLIIDPLTAHLGDEVNSWREQDVRAKVFAPLHTYANESGCAVVLVMHLNKSNSNDPLARISGSGGFAGAARFILLLGSHPDDLGLDEHERRLALVHVKASEGRRRPAMVYRRRERHLELEDDEIASVPVFELVDDDARISPDSVLEHTDPDEAGAFTEALEFLRGELMVGPKLAKRLLATTRERGDFSERTLRKAKRALGVKSDKDAEGWWWVWSPDSKGRR